MPRTIQEKIAVVLLLLVAGLVGRSLYVRLQPSSTADEIEKTTTELDEALEQYDRDREIRRDQEP